MAFKELSLFEVPSEYHEWFSWNDQFLAPMSKGKDGIRNTTFIKAMCSKCFALYPRRVSHIRQYLKAGLELNFYCPDCRPDAKWVTSQGYVMMYRPGHPNARKNGTILEHVFVMSETIGRALLPEENVHHKNGCRNDNRPENLELWSTVQPAGQRIEDKIRWAIELKDEYPDVWRRVRNQMKREACQTEKQSSTEPSSAPTSVSV